MTDRPKSGDRKARSKSKEKSPSRRDTKRSESPVKRLEIVKDEDIEETAVDKQLRELNEERRKLLKKREQSSKY